MGLILSETETPPRGWGRLILERGELAGLGNTPTRVGKTHIRPDLCIRRKKHPHAGGEDVPLSICPDPALETPPRGWGRHEKTAQARFSGRNTPTRVGKTVEVHLCGLFLRKHPHAGREDGSNVCLITMQPETPPRGWGRPCRMVVWFACARNTPTRVGKTFIDRIKNAKERKHPHAGGEDGRAAQCSGVVLETPPRGWGRPGHGTLKSGQARNTPTRVGKTHILEFI